MKKSISIMTVAIIAAVLIAGCNENQTATPRAAMGNGEAVSADVENNPGKSLDIDVDIAGLSLLVVHGEVNKILNNPDSYAGKRIRMSGPYYHISPQGSSARYHFVAVEIADDCCIRGLEFIWEGGDAFPDGYPQDWADIEVTGVYNSYEEDGMVYYYIAVDSFNML